MEKFFVPVAALLLVLVCFGFVPQLAVLTRNRVAATTSSCVPPQARELHEAVEIVGLACRFVSMGKRLARTGQPRPRGCSETS